MADPKLTYAGINLPVRTSELDGWMNKWIDPNQVYYYDNRVNISGAYHLAIPPIQDLPPIELGVLRWPQGASRWATYYCAVDGKTLDDIRYAAQDETGNYYEAQPLVMSDSIKTLTTDMIMLPPRPLSAVMKTLSANSERSLDEREVNELYLLTLVDSRYLWWFKQTDLTPPASWSALFSALGTSLGITITLDNATVPSAYDIPNGNRWNLKRKPLPYLLDAAANAIGRKLTRKLDGTVRVEDAAAALVVDTAEYDLTRNKIAGAYLFLNDRLRNLPDSVDVVFLDTVGTSVSTTVNKTLASLSLTEVGDYTGDSRRTGLIYADLADPGAGATRDNYVTQAVTDYYKWRALGGADIVYPGLTDSTPNGLIDCIKWRMDAERCMTRYTGLPIKLDPDAGQIQSGSGSNNGVLKPTLVGIQCDTLGNFNQFFGGRYGPAITVGGRVMEADQVTPVEGETVTLQNAGGGSVISTTTTNALGAYCFEITQASSTVEVTAGGSYTPSAQSVIYSSSPTDVFIDFIGV